MFPRQYSLSLLFFLTTIWCCLAAAAHWLGVAALSWLLMAAFGVGCVVAVWAAAYNTAPLATKYSTVIGLLGTLLLSVLSLWISDAREDARRLQSAHALRLLGRQQALSEESHPGVLPTGSSLGSATCPVLPPTHQSSAASRP